MNYFAHGDEVTAQTNESASMLSSPVLLAVGLIVVVIAGLAIYYYSKRVKNTEKK